MKLDSLKPNHSRQVRTLWKTLCNRTPSRFNFIPSKYCPMRFTDDKFILYNFFLKEKKQNTASFFCINIQSCRDVSFRSYWKCKSKWECGQKKGGCSIFRGHNKRNCIYTLWTTLLEERCLSVCSNITGLGDMTEQAPRFYKVILFASFLILFMRRHLINGVNIISFWTTLSCRSVA